MKYFFALILLSSTVYAQDTLLEPIQVTAEQKHPTWQDFDKTNILNGKKNRKSDVNYIPPIQTDLLRQHFSQHSSIHTPEQATEPWTIMNYRGFGSPQEGQSLLILQDGLPVSFDMYGQADNNYAPPSPLMESLQVIGGGGALLYGPQPSAAINYLTPTLTRHMQNHGRINASAGSYNLFSTVNAVTGSSGNTSYYGGYYRKQGDGYQRTNGDFFSDNLQFKTNTFISGNRIFKSSFQGFDSDYGMPGGMSLIKAPGFNTWGQDNRKATRKHNRFRISRMQLMLGLEKKLESNTLVDAQMWASAYRRYNKTQTGSGFGKFPTGNSNTINNSHNYGLNGEVRIKHDYEKWNEKHVLSGGYLTFNSNSPAVNMRGSGPGSNNGEVTSRLYRKTRVQAVFAENQFSFGKFAITPGIRLENITLAAENNDKTTDVQISRSETYNILLGGLSSSYYLTETTQAYASISEGFKPVGYDDVISQGNPNYTVSGDIKPSYSYFYEAGVRHEQKKIDWDTSLYIIHRQHILASTANVLSNGESALYRGIESSVTFKDFLNSGSHNEIDFYFNANFNNAQYRQGQFKGKTPAHVPSLLLKYGLVYRRENAIKASLMATYVNEHYSDDAHSDNYKVPTYYLFDFLMEYSLNQNWSMNGAINNLLDNEYYARVMPTGVMPTMGRNMYAGLNYRF